MAGHAEALAFFKNRMYIEKARSLVIGLVKNLGGEKESCQKRCGRFVPCIFFPGYCPNFSRTVRFESGVAESAGKSRFFTGGDTPKKRLQKRKAI